MPAPNTATSRRPRLQNKKSFSLVSNWLLRNHHTSTNDHARTISLDSLTNAPRPVTAREGFYSVQIPPPVSEGGRNADIVVCVNYGREVSSLGGRRSEESASAISSAIEEEDDAEEASTVVSLTLGSEPGDGDATEATAWTPTPLSSPEVGGGGGLSRTKTFGERDSGRDMVRFWGDEGAADLELRRSQVGVAC